MKHDLITFLSFHFNQEQIMNALNDHSHFKKKGDKIPRGKFTEVVDLELCKILYEEYQLPFSTIAKLYNASDVTIREYLLKLGVTSRSHRVSKDEANTYFSNVNTKAKAYYLGLIMADGSLSQTHNQISLSLNSEDGYIIRSFKKDAQLQAAVKDYTRTDRNRTLTHIAIRSSQMYNDLINLNVLPCKSIDQSTKIPNIQDKLKKHFIRGYYDGNGIAFSDGKIGFCGSQQLLTDIQEYYVQRYNVEPVNVTYNKQNHIYYLVYGAIQKVITVYNDMYKNCDNLYLIRKKEKIRNGIQARGVEIR